MRLERFRGERRAAWAELQDLLARSADRPERLEPDSLLRLGALYRATAADLALARRAFPGDPITAELERLVLRARQAVYADAPPRGSLRSFLSTGYWRLVRERPGLLAIAAALLFVPQVLGAVWALDDPGAAIGIVPSEYQGVGEVGGEAATLSGEDRAAMSSQILTNNIRVSFLAIAGGIVLGLGTAAVLLYNGIFLGAIEGLVIGAGQAGPLFEFIVPHGVLELSLIVVSGAAGLRIGRAILEPGTLTRAQSLRREAGPAMQVVLGSMPWFVLAGLVEGFVTGSLPGLAAAIAVGALLGAVYWALVLWRGRPDQSRPRPLALR